VWDWATARSLDFHSQLLLTVVGSWTADCKSSTNSFTIQRPPISSVTLENPDWYSRAPEGYPAEFSAATPICPCDSWEVPLDASVSVCVFILRFPLTSLLAFSFQFYFYSYKAQAWFQSGIHTNPGKERRASTAPHPHSCLSQFHGCRLGYGLACSLVYPRVSRAAVHWEFYFIYLTKGCLHCQHDWAWNHLGDTALGVSVRVFQRWLTEKGMPVLNVSSTVPHPGVLKRTVWKNNCPSPPRLLSALRWCEESQCHVPATVNTPTPSHPAGLSKQWVKMNLSLATCFLKKRFIYAYEFMEVRRGG
jgi:hypothetical protein